MERAGKVRITVNEQPCYKWQAAEHVDVYHARMNPLKQVFSARMPQIRCSCDNERHYQWREQYLDLKDPELLEMPSPYNALDKDDWLQFAADLRARHGLPADLPLYPGAGISIPEFEISNSTINDVIWPVDHVLITARLAEIFESAGLTGYRLVPGRVRWSRKMLQRGLALPELFVMQVTSYAWRLGSTWREICPICGSFEYSQGGKSLDPERWDGSDFFHLDNDHLGVWVTEKVKDVLIANRIKNFSLIPVSEELTLEEYNEACRTGTFTHHPGIPLGYKP